MDWANYSFVLVLLNTVSYLPVFGAGLVWDDDKNILERQNLQELAGLERIWGDPTSTRQGYPLTHTSSGSKQEPAGSGHCHFTSSTLALHVMTALLLLHFTRVSAWNALNSQGTERPCSDRIRVTGSL